MFTARYGLRLQIRTFRHDRIISLSVIYIYIYNVDGNIKADSSLLLLSSRFELGTHNVTFVTPREV